ncbi:MAG: M1 family aminopeptidase [Clostridiales bacterium]
MRLKFVTFFLLVLSATALSQNNNDFDKIVKTEAGRFNKLQNLNKIMYPGDSTIDVTYYKLELNIANTPHVLKGVTTIGIKSNSVSLTTFFLDLQGGMTADSVVLDNQRLTISHTNNQLFITLPRAYNMGELFYLKAYYQGDPDPSGFGSYIDTTHNGQRIVWTLSEPYGAKDWFVCKDTPADKVDSSDVWVTCPSAMVVASNGTLQSDQDNGNGTHTVKWKNHYRIAQYLISIALTNYTLYTNYFKYSPTDSMIVTHFVFPENFNDQTRAQMNQTLLMLKIYSDRFGLYPFIKEKYGHAQFMWGGGMEHQTITSLVDFSETLVSHELGHQWFGDKVTCARWQDIWLNEGFAEYTTAVYFEGAYGKDRYNSDISYEMQRAKFAKGSVFVQDISSTDEIFNGPRSYAKGAVVLHMLRAIVGDSTFFKILRNYLVDPKLSYNVAITQDFQAVAERIYGQSLKYFFDEWIFGENYPQYNFSWSSKTNANSSQVSINLNQKTNSNPTFFTMPVQFKISTSLGDTLVTVMNNSQNQTFTLTVNGTASNVSFDPNNLILKDIIVTGVDDHTTAGEIDFRLDQNFPNPFNPETKIKFQIAKSSNSSKQNIKWVTLKIFDILGNEIATLLDDFRPAGEYEISFNAENYGLSSGIYYYQLKADDFTDSKKMMYLK